MMTNNPFSLRGKTILVTGASSGIGRAIAIQCSIMGANICLCGRNINRLKDTYSLLLPGNHFLCAGDLTVAENRSQIVDTLPLLDGVVHNAGIAKRQLCKQVKEEDLNNILTTNFTSTVMLQKELLKSKKIVAGASIVIMASRAAISPSVGNAIYSASKGALISYAKVLGLELSAKHIRVNCICPGMVDTDLIKKEGKLLGTDFSDINNKYPLGRFGTPEDIAYLAIYLLSDASQWMTGSCIDISGGGEMTLV